MTGPTSRLCLLLVCIASALESAQSGPLPNDGVLVEQVMRTSSSGVRATAASTHVTVGDEGGGGGGFDGGVDNESVLDTSAGASDDLIFLTARKPTTTLQQEKEQQHHDHQQQSPAQNPHHHHRGVHQIDSLATETTSSSCEEDDNDDDVVWEEYDPESRNENLSSSGSTIAPPPALDMRPFVALIPADEVKTIAGKYYRRDPEVQRAYAYLSGRDFVELRQRIVDVPEMAAFLRFLRASGLDVLGFLQSLTNLTKGAAEAESVTEATVLMAKTAMTSSSGQTNAIGVNSIQGSSLGERDSAIEKVASSSPAPATTTTTEGEAEQSLNGLHGLVDSVLDILPQDQILSTFFDKLDSDERFARLVDNVSSPDFARILRNMENSVPLRNLIFTLHNNGIYITRIVDSLKAYFFLGGF